MNIKYIFKQKVSLALISITVVLGINGCKKGTFDINSTNPNTPSSVPAQYSLSSSLTATASLVYSGNADILQNWMGYWTQSGGFTPSTTYVLYQLTSGTGSGNWDLAYQNLENYKLLLTTAGTIPSQANYRAIAMIMTSFVYQRIVDLYNKAPYTVALTPNSQFSYPYDDGAAIYKTSIARLDSAVTIISSNTSVAASPSNYDVMFKGNMTKWIKFAKTLKLKMLMRQTQGGIGSAAVQQQLASMKQTDFLGVGEDGAINPGYSNASNAQENPYYYDIVANANNAPGLNTQYYRANTYAVNFYYNTNDPRVGYFYELKSDGKAHGRAYGSTVQDPNSAISAVFGTGKDASGNYKGASQDAVILPAFESLFLQAEAIQRGYIAGSVSDTYKNAVSESFRILGISNSIDATGTYISQNNALTNITTTTNPIQTIITQKWAACNTYDPLESYSDWRRLGIPADLPVSIYPGNTATHIPYRFPYPTSELNYNSANVPSGGSGTDALTSKIFWMP